MTTPTEDFETFVKNAKQKWIMEESGWTTSSELIDHMDRMYKNMLADGSWKNTNEKNDKIIALSTTLQNTNAKLKKVEKMLTETKKAGGKSGGGGGDDKEKKSWGVPDWQIKYKGNLITHPEKNIQMVWCPEHKSQNGKVDGMHMPHPHNHADSAKKKKERTERFRRKKRDRAAAKAAGAEKSTNPSAGSDKSKKDIKLALNQKLATALVTQHHFSQNEAEAFLNEAYTEAEKSLN